jgi:hypothetical protein
MHLTYFKDLKTGKDLKRPAARLTGNGAPGSQQAPIISLEKMGVSDAMENQSDTYAKI